MVNFISKFDIKCDLAGFNILFLQQHRFSCLAFAAKTSRNVCKISLSFRFRISLSDMTNYKSAFGKVCRIKNRQTFKSMPILNSAY